MLTAKLVLACHTGTYPSATIASTDVAMVCGLLSQLRLPLLLAGLLLLSVAVGGAAAAIALSCLTYVMHYVIFHATFIGIQPTCWPTALPEKWPLLARDSIGRILALSQRWSFHFHVCHGAASAETLPFTQLRF